MLKRSKLHKIGKSPLALVKRRIQALLRGICILRDGGCVLRNSPEAGQCGGFRDDGELILQAEHLNSRQRNVSYGDMRNIVCLCKYHHLYFKEKNGRLYWELIEKIIGEERWKYLKEVESYNKICLMGVWEWRKIEIALGQELTKYQ